MQTRSFDFIIFDEFRLFCWLLAWAYLELDTSTRGKRHVAPHNTFPLYFKFRSFNCHAKVGSKFLSSKKLQFNFIHAPPHRLTTCSLLRFIRAPIIPKVQVQ